jgi:hypothetical protein
MSIVYLYVGLKLLLTPQPYDFITDIVTGEFKLDMYLDTFDDIYADFLYVPFAFYKSMS